MAEAIADTPTSSAIELRHLRYFLAVVEQKHFGHAAEQMHVSQPQVSRAIRQLEDGLGVQLLNRTRGAVTVTEAGRTFVDEARRILANVDVAIGEARRAGGAESTLRIGALDYLPIEQVQRFLKSLRQREPTLQLRVTHLSMPEQTRRLREGALDLGILAYAEERQDIAMEPLSAGEPIEAMLPRDHGLGASGVLGPEELRDQTLIQGPRAANPALYDWFMALLEESGYSFRSLHVIDTTNPRDLVLAVAAGQGVMLRPRSFRAVDEAGINVTRAALDPELIMPDTVIAWRTNPPRYLSQVLAVIREVAREMRAVSPAT
jgi:DNA-binding transcriptional LysR family regulator